jgi:cell volume regulation protein A
LDPVSLFLLVVAAVFVVGIVGEVAFRRSGVPDVLWLVAVGCLLGPVTGVVARDALARVAPYFGAVTIVLVLFDGGMALRLDTVGRASARAGALAVLGFAASAAAVAAGSMGAAKLGVLPETWTWAHAATLGAILGGSSSIVVMPALRTADAPPALAGLLSLESALTDVLCIVGTGAAVEILVARSVGAGSTFGALGRSFAVGIGVGGAMGALAVLLLRALRRASHAFPIVLASLFALYVVAGLLGGSAPLAILAAAVLVGNARSVAHLIGLAHEVDVGRTLRGAHSQVAFIVKTFFFVFMGAMIGPPWGLVALGAALAVGLAVARIPAVAAATAGMGLDPRSRALAFACLPRGLAAGVLAAAPAEAGVVEMTSVPAVVYSTVAASIVLFTAGFAIARRFRPDSTASVGAAPAPDA